MMVTAFTVPCDFDIEMFLTNILNSIHFYTVKKYFSDYVRNVGLLFYHKFFHFINLPALLLCHGD